MKDIVPSLKVFESWDTTRTRYKIHIPQINIALLYSSDGLPAVIKALPGSVRDLTSIYNSVKDKYSVSY